MSHITIPATRHPWANPVAALLKRGAGMEGIQAAKLNIPNNGFQFAFTNPSTGIASGKPTPGAIRGYDPSTYQGLRNVDYIRDHTPPLPENKYLPADTVTYNVLNANFAAAQAEFPLYIRNNFLFFNWWSAVGTTTPQLNIRIGDNRNDQITFTPGMRLRGFGCDKLYISWPLVAGETGQLIYAYKADDVESLF